MAAEILRNICLEDDKIEIDSTSDLIVFLGDLNFRMNSNFEEQKD